MGLVVLLQQILNAEMAQLMAIRFSRQCEAARCRQPRSRQTGKIRGLGADPFRVSGERIIKVKDKCGHTCLMSRQRQSLGTHPLPCCGERENRTRTARYFTWSP